MFDKLNAFRIATDSYSESPNATIEPLVTPETNSLPEVQMKTFWKLVVDAASWTLLCVLLCCALFSAVIAAYSFGISLNLYLSETGAQFKAPGMIGCQFGFVGLALVAPAAIASRNNKCLREHIGSGLTLATLANAVPGVPLAFFCCMPFGGGEARFYGALLLATGLTVLFVSAIVTCYLLSSLGETHDK